MLRLYKINYLILKKIDKIKKLWYHEKSNFKTNMKEGFYMSSLGSLGSLDSLFNPVDAFKIVAIILVVAQIVLFFLKIKKKNLALLVPAVNIGILVVMAIIYIFQSLTSRELTTSFAWYEAVLLQGWYLFFSLPVVSVLGIVKRIMVSKRLSKKV